MTTATAKSAATNLAPPSSTAAPRSPALSLATVPLWVWWLIAVAAITAMLSALAVTTDPNFQAYVGDTDDATRLLEVREFLGGTPWFDPVTYKLGGAHGLLTHWSRLIDLPLAAITRAAELFVPQETAVDVARIVWPITVLASLLWVVTVTVAKAAGATASRYALLLTVLSPLAIAQFRLGRVDHHNVMIAATLLSILTVWAYTNSARAWALAGAALGFALVIGFEALAPAAALAVAVALWGLLDRAQARQARSFTLALMLTLTAGFLLTIPPSRWTDIRCDAISLNFVALGAVAGTGLIIALKRSEQTSFFQRFAIAALFTVAGVAIYGALEPRCLMGPMGQVPLELKTVWLDDVAETRSIVADLFSGNVTRALAFAAYFTLAVAVQALRFRKTRSNADLFLLAITACVMLLGVWQYKFLHYAGYLANIPIAIWLANLGGIGKARPGIVQCAAIVCCNLTSFLTVSAYIQQWVTPHPVLTAEELAGVQSCKTNAAVRELKAVPPGLMAAAIDLGPYIAYLTDHRALAAPYHRIPDAILANHHLFAAHDMRDAQKILEREKIDYVVICADLDRVYAKRDEWRGTVRENLVNGKAPSFLTPVPLAAQHPKFTVWRVAPDTVNLQP